MGVELIDLVVILAHLQRQFGVFAHEGVQTFTDHALGNTRHPRNVDVRLKLRFLIELQGALADVDRHVADPFQISGNFQSRSDKAQIAAGRLMER